MSISLIIIYITLVAVCTVAVLALWNHRLFPMRSDRRGRLLPQRKQKKLITNALRELNCECVWEKNNDEWHGKYDFQNGHFRITIQKNSPFARLSFLFIQNTTTENLDIIRILCNQCNLNSDNARIFYTINEQNALVDSHISLTVVCQEKQLKDLLLQAMKDAFSWQVSFIKRFEELTEDQKHVLNTDIEKDHLHFNREIHLIREQELLHQKSAPAALDSEGKIRTLAQLLKQVFNIQDFLPTRLSMIRDEKTTSLIHPDNVKDLDLSSILIHEGKFAYHNATLNLHYYDRQRPEKEREMIIHVKSEISPKEALYYRITATIVPLSMQEIIPFESKENKIIAHSVLLGMDLATNKMKRDEYYYLWKEALAMKSQGKTAEMNAAQQLVAAVFDPQLSYNLYRGRILVEQKRYYEASLYLENAFNMMSPMFENMGQDAKDTYYEVCYLLGFCFNGLRNYALAYYYLDIVTPLHNIIYTEEYINCMVNNSDPRACNVIDGLLADLEESEDDDEEDDEEDSRNLEEFISFLKRRKAYVLIERQKYDEAEQLLKTMLSDPNSSDFAINELAFLRQVKK